MHFRWALKIPWQHLRVWIIEKDPVEDDLDESAAHTLVPQADIAAITGTSLTNHTMGYLADEP